MRRGRGRRLDTEEGARRYGGRSATPAWEVAPLQDKFGETLQKTASGKMSPYSGKVRSPGVCFSKSVFEFHADSRGLFELSPYSGKLRLSSALAKLGVSRKHFNCSFALEFLP